ncbi:hypothetical protein Hdeb2414_s0061g00763191 [Helianthus debilis subsp. tardiflorus]
MFLVILEVILEKHKYQITLWSITWLAQKVKICCSLVTFRIMSIKSSAYEPGRIYSAGNQKFNFASEIFVEALVCRCLLPFTTTVRSNGYVLQVNDDSNRGDGSESGFGGSDNVEGAFGGEQDIPTDSSSTSRWRQKYHRQTPQLFIKWIDWMKSSKLLSLNHHRHLFRFVFAIGKWW